MAESELVVKLTVGNLAEFSTELKALINVARAAQRLVDHRGRGVNPILEPDEPGAYEFERDLAVAVAALKAGSSKTSSVDNSYGDNQEVIENVAIRNYLENRDGIHIGTLQDVRITNCIISPVLTRWERLRLRLGFTVRGMRRV